MLRVTTFMAANVSLVLEKIAPHLSILLIAALSAPGALAGFVEFLFFPPFALVRFGPLALGLFFYLGKKYNALYITTVLFLLVTLFSIVSNIGNDPWGTYTSTGWWQL